MTLTSIDILDKINQKIYDRKELLKILEELNAGGINYSTVGIIEIRDRGGSIASSESDWFRDSYPEIEKELKERARDLISRKIAELDVWLSKINIHLQS